MSTAFGTTIAFGHAERAAMALGCAAAAAASAVGLLAHGWVLTWTGEAPSWCLGIAAAAAALPAALAGWRVLPTTAWQLQSSGGAWQLRASAEPAWRSGKLEPMIDLGGWMLLRFRDVGMRRGGTWLAIDRAGAGMYWHPLRAAVFGPLGAAADG